jgi:uncharacterized protein
VLTFGAAKRVTIYVGEDDQYHGHSLYAALLDFLFYRGVAGASVTRGIAGFGASHRLRTTRILRLSENLPVKIDFIDSSEKVNEILPKLREMARNSLIEVQDTNVLRPGQETVRSAPSPAPHLCSQSHARMMRIFIGESDRWRDKPLYNALVEAFRANNIAGVTVYEGLMGYGANRRIHQPGRLHLSHDRPVMLTVVDTEDKIRSLLPLLDEMITQGLVVLSDVEMVKYAHGAPGGSATSGEESETP